MKMRRIMVAILLLCSAATVTVLFVAGSTESLGNENIVVSSHDTTSDKIQFQKIPECSCERPSFYPTHTGRGTPFSILNSSCSDEGTFYQGGQKVVTFSLYYGNRRNNSREKLYKEGISLNLQRMREHYPGHSMRIYTDVKLEGDYCRFLCTNSDLFWCDIKNVPGMGDMSKMFYPNWRFLTLGDPSVEYFLSRDMDSGITKREKDVVQDWLQVGKPIHLMRDKLKAHHTAILAGMWGARNNLLGEELALSLRQQIIDMAIENRKYKGQDQSILSKVIFYPRRKDIVAYDSYHCKYWGKFTYVKPFPTKRADNVSDFVGNFDLGRKTYDELPICPEECRPNYGRDWKYC